MRKLRNFTAFCLGFLALASAGFAVAQGSAPAPKDAPAPSVYGMTKAFDSAAKFVPVNDWKGNNDLQKEFVQDFIGLGKEANKLPKSMLDAVASDDVKVVNNFLKKHGLTIQLQPFGTGGFGAAAVLSVEAQWWAETTEITGVDGKKYPGVKRAGVEFFKMPGHLEPVVRIYESASFNVYVTAWDGEDEGFNAVRMAQELTPGKTAKVYPKNYERIRMPMVDMDRTSELNWLKGMSDSNGHHVQQAVAQTRLKLDDKGFSVKEGFAFGGLGAARRVPTTYDLNKPFLLWVEVDGLTYPFFAVKVDTKYWKNPSGQAAK